MCDEMITLGGIWTDFFEVIKKEAGHGIIVEISKSRDKKEYIVHQKKPSKPLQLKILLTHVPDNVQDPNAAGGVINGIATTRSGAAAAAKEMLFRASVGEQTFIIEESKHIETIIRKTLAVKLLNARNFTQYKDVSEQELSKVSVAEQDYIHICKILLGIVQNRYVETYTGDTRYDWLFKSYRFDDHDKVPQYLTALLCAAIISLQITQAQKEARVESEQNRARLTRSVIEFLCIEKKTSHKDVTHYFEKLWLNHCKGALRDWPGTGAVRELIDFYAVPDFILNSSHYPIKQTISKPFSDLRNYAYITAGSGFGKTTLLHMILLSGIIDELIAAKSTVISANSRDKVAEYSSIKQALFGTDQKQVFPVFISSADVNESHEKNVLDLAEAHDINQFKDMVREAHDAGILLFLIDSLDEVEHGKKRDDYISGIQKLLKEDYPNARAILTSRFLGREQLPFECKNIQIEKLGEDVIKKIIKGLLSERSATELATEIDRITGNKRMLSLVQNPFMLVSIFDTKGDRTINTILKYAVNAIIARRWDKKDHLEDIMLLLGYLACMFAFGRKADASVVDVRAAFIQAKKILKKANVTFEMTTRDMNQFLYLLSSQSGIINVICDGSIEKYVFQDDFLMSWLAANYIVTMLLQMKEICFNEEENTLWANAMCINSFFQSFTCEQCVLSANAVNAIVFAMVQNGNREKPVLPKSLLYYLLFKGITSENADERANIKAGYQDLLHNSFGSTQLTTNSTHPCYRMISSAIESL